MPSNGGWIRVLVTASNGDVMSKANYTKQGKRSPSVPWRATVWHPRLRQQIYLGLFATWVEAFECERSYRERKGIAPYDASRIGNPRGMQETA